MTMSIDFKTFDRIIPHAVRARKPIMLRSRHGVGKSEWVHQLSTKIANWLNLEDKNYVYPIVERRASQMADAGDLMGLPKLVDDATTFLPMMWFNQASNQPCILLLDELDRGAQDVRQAIFELADSRRIAGHVLHPDTIIFACCNSGQGENQYQVGEMDPAELSRWSVFDLKPTEKDWLDYAKNKVEPYVHDFIRQNPSFLEHRQGEFEPNKVYPSRRSWFRLNSALAGSGLLDRGNNLSTDLLFLACAYVGDEPATAFFDFCKNYDRQLTPDDIINKGLAHMTKNWEISQHATLIDKIGESDLSKVAFTDEQLRNVASYLLSVHVELAMTLWQNVCRNHAENGVKLFDCSVEDNSVHNYLAYITNDDEKAKTQPTKKSTKKSK